MELSREGIFAQQRADQLVTASDTAGAMLEADRAAVGAAAGAVAADRARLAQTELQLRSTRVVAPMDGRARAVMIKAGNIVRENDTTLVDLLQISPIHVTFGLPQQSLGEVQRRNARGPLMVEAVNVDGSTMRGQVTFIDSSVDATTGTVRLKAKFDNAAGTLWPGQLANVRLRLGCGAAEDPGTGERCAGWAGRQVRVGDPVGHREDCARERAAHL